MRERNGGMGCSLLFRRKSGLGEIMLEVLNASQGHDALAPRSTPAEGFLVFIGRVQVWVEGDLPPLLVAPWKWIGLVLSVGRGVHVNRPCRLWRQRCLSRSWRVFRHWWSRESGDDLIGQ